MTPLRAHGFSLIELLVVVALIALLIGILLPVLSSAQRAARVTRCSANLQQFGVATGAYAGDYDGQIWAFTWRKGHANSDDADLNGSRTTFIAVGDQAIDIVRRELVADIPPIARRTNWLAPVWYSHLTLLRYNGRPYSYEPVICPSDKGKLDDAADPRAFREDEPSIKWQWPYKTTYTPVPAAYDLNQSTAVRSTDTARGSAVWRRQTQANSWNTHVWYEDRLDTDQAPRGAKAGGVRTSIVAFPAQKVHLYDREERHFGRTRLYATPGARQPLLFFDASVRTLPIDDAAPAWDPRDPGDPDGLLRPDPVTGAMISPRFRWTRGGLRGVDYAGSSSAPTSAAAR